MSLSLDEARRIIEALIFAAPHPITVLEISNILDLEQELVQRIIEMIKEQYAKSGITLRVVAGGYQFVTRPEFAPWIEKIGRPVITTPLSAAGLETLAIVAYKQPITRSEIEEIRGVSSQSAINTLLERELIVELGRRDGPGRPIIYGTTNQFLIHFGLKSLDDLPQVDNLPDYKSRDA